MEAGNNNMRTDEPLLRMEGICKSFPGVRALDNVSLTVRGGSVHALMGENGAGKSTLMKCLFGVYSKDSGHIYLDGREVDFKSPAQALENGVAMVHQELNQALKRSVMDNMWLGRFPRVSRFIPLTSGRKMYRASKALFDELGIGIDPKTVMGRMSVSQRQMVEIAKAVSYNSRVIVFDEPTSSLTEEEAEHLFRIIGMLRSRGCGIVYISHKMEEILKISDEVTVLSSAKMTFFQKVQNKKLKVEMQLRTVFFQLQALFDNQTFDEIIGVLLCVLGRVFTHNECHTTDFLDKARCFFVHRNPSFHKNRGIRFQIPHILFG